MNRFFPVDPKPGHPISMRGLAEGIAKLGRALAGMQVENGRMIWSNLDVPTISFGDDGSGMSPALAEAIEAINRASGLWKVSVNGATLTIGAGAIQYNGTMVTSAAADVTVTTDTQYIGWKYTLSSGVLEVITTPSATPIVPATGLVQGTLYKITSAGAGAARKVTGVEPWQYNYAVAPFVPAGTATGDIMHWDATNKVWVVSTVGTPTTGDFLRWDGSKWVKAAMEQVTFIAAWRLDKTNHYYQTKSRTGYVYSPSALPETWTNVSDADGGLLDQGVIPADLE